MKQTNSNENCTLLADLPQHALDYIQHLKDGFEKNTAEFQEMVARPDADISYAIQYYGDKAKKAQHMHRFFLYLDRALTREDGCGRVRDGLEGFQDRYTDQLDSWHPTNSTCLHTRADGDLDLECLREQRDILKAIFKTIENAKVVADEEKGA